MTEETKKETPKRSLLDKTQKKYSTGGTLFKRLAQIQQELKAPKNQYNSFGNYSYRNTEDILEALKPLLGDCVVLVNDRIVQIGERYYVEATAVFTDGVERITNTAYAREPEDKKGMDASQITGATSSYARKYALNGLFAIDDTKDADSGKVEVKKTSKVTKPTGELASEGQRKMIFALAKGKGMDAETIKGLVKTRYKLESFNDLTKGQAKAVIDGITK